ncbi:MAG TPA: PAS domain-containing protein [Pyrinomonadaceae bacterium]|nr:PAS domain-containing protein [Pyrinomonadaceae bacterium]
MKAPDQESIAEIQSLQRCINNLVEVLGFPADQTGGESAGFVNGLLETLLRMLDLDFVYARLNVMEEESNEFVRIAEPLQTICSPLEIGEVVKPWLGKSPPKRPRLVKNPFGGGKLSIVISPLGAKSEFGQIVLASRRSDFPRKTEKIVLDVATNQALIGLQARRLQKKQKPVAIGFNQAQAERAKEDLAEVNEELKKKVAELKQTEDELRRSEREMHLVVDNIPGPVALLSPTGGVEVVNRELTEYFGQTLEELSQWGTNNGTVHPEDLPHVIETFTRSLADGTPYDILQRFRRFDGVYCWFQNKGFPLRDSNEEITRWCVLLTDIDEQKRAESALRMSEHQFGLLVETIPALVWCGTPEGELAYLNQRAVEYLGQTAQSLAGGGWLELVHPDHRDATIRRWLHSATTGVAYEDVYQIRRSDGQYRWIQSVGEPFRDTDGRIACWYGLIIDIDERKRAEGALAASENNLKLIIDTIPVLAWSARPDGNADYFNQHYLDYTGFSAEQASGWGWTAALHPDDLENLATTWQSIMAGGELGEAEARLRRYDGKYRWFLFRSNPMRDENGRIVKWYGVNTDIEDRKRAEAQRDHSIEELQARQELLDLAQKSAGAMAFDWYIQQDINVWSPEQECLYGLPPGSFDGTYQSWKRLIYPPDWSLVLEAIKHAHETGVVAVEFRVKWSDGSIHWLATNGRMFFDEHGKPFRMVGFTSDVTSRKLAEEELRRSQAFLLEAQHLSSTGSFSWHQSTDTITWSDEIYRIFEFDRSVRPTLELIRSRIHPDDLAMWTEAMDKTLEGSHFELDYRLLLPDGRVKYLHAIAHAARDSASELEYIGALQDVTAQRMSEESLSKLRSELAHVSRVTTLGTLTASVAHEVNQPLSGIITNASTCLRMLDASPPNIDGARETARRTIRDGNRASDVIKRLRALFSRKDFTVEEVNLNDAAREVIELSRDELQRNRIVLQTELAEDLPSIAGDRVQLQQVILNLILNAVDAMSDVHDRPRQLMITTESDGGERVRLSVRDGGISFAPETGEKLFDAFYTTKKSGMGIGLSVSRSIIEKHLGRLWAERNEGPGAVFSFSIPALDKSGDKQVGK